MCSEECNWNIPQGCACKWAFIIRSRLLCVDSLSISTKSACIFLSRLPFPTMQISNLRKTNKIGEFIRKNVEPNFKKRTKHGDVKSMQLNTFLQKAYTEGIKSFAPMTNDLTISRHFQRWRRSNLQLLDKLKSSCSTALDRIFFQTQFKEY